MEVGCAVAVDGDGAVAVGAGTSVLIGAVAEPAVGVAVGISVPLRVGSFIAVGVVPNSVGLLLSVGEISVAATITTARLVPFDTAASTVPG